MNRSPRSSSLAAISVSELVAGTLALVLLGATVTTFAQTPAPPSQTSPAQPPATIGANRPVVARGELRVLADPSSKMYMPCRSADEVVDPDATPYTPNPKATVMTEDAAKAKGFRASAHKVSCPE